MATFTTMHMMLESEQTRPYERKSPPSVQLRQHPTHSDCWFLMIRDDTNDFTISGTSAQMEDLGRRLQFEVDRVGWVPRAAKLGPNAAQVDK